MISLSLDHRLDEIYDANTKEYFAEVVKTYNAESYRSTIVLLYSVLICDLLYKLTELRERHQDENAQRILNEVATKRKANLTSSDWEKYLVDEMSKTELLEISDKCNINHLKNHRNLAAHPQLNNNNKLYKPTRADAQAHMYNMFEGVFCKSPILTKKIFNDFITNLAEIKDYKMNDDQLKAFLNARYFSNMRLNVKEYLFQNLWKFIFEKTNKECDDNRQINLQALCIIYAENSVHFSNIIRNNNQSFKELKNDEIFRALHSFLSRFPENFKALSQELQVIIKRTFDRQEVYFGSSVDMYLEEKINAIYLSDNIDEHIKLITTLLPSIRYITGYQNFISLFEKCNYEDQLKLIDLVLDIIKNCYSYVYADDIQNHILTHLIKYFNEEKTIQLLDGINNNNQFYDRREYRITKHMLVHHGNTVLKNDFNYSKYTNLKLS